MFVKDLKLISKKLYSGFLYMMGLRTVVYYIVTVFYKLLSSLLILKFSQNYNCDGSVGLYLLSSPTLTWWLLGSLFIYLNIKHRPACFVLNGFLILYYFLDPWAYLNVVYEKLLTQKVNITLQNGILVIHPVIIYYMYGVSAVMWFYMYFNNTTILCANIKNFCTHTILILWGVLLGAVWAVQELNWGGFWSWDPVELSSLLLVVYTSYNFHQYSKNFSKQSPVLLLIISIFVIYCLVRLGIINTVHSFIKNSTLSIYVYLYFVAASVCICFFYIGTTLRFYITATPHFKNITQVQHVNPYYVFLRVITFTLLSYLLFMILYNLLLIPQFFDMKLSYIYLVTTFGLLYYITLSTVVRFLLKQPLALIWCFIFLMLYYPNTLSITLIIGVFVCAPFFRKNSKIHAVFFVCLLLSHYFIIQLNNYNGFVSQQIQDQISVLDSGYFISSEAFYENFLVLKKSVYITNVKNLEQHILNFSVVSNLTSSFFVFIKNYNVYNLFCEDFAFLFVFFMSIIVGFFNLYLYRYYTDTTIIYT